MELSNRSIRVKELIHDEVCMGTFGIVEIELIDFDKEKKDLQSQLKEKDKDHELDLASIEILKKEIEWLKKERIANSVDLIKENTKLKQDIGTVLEELTISSLKKGEIELLKEENKGLREGIKFISSLEPNRIMKEYIENLLNKTK
jgi:hypothetical protein